MKRKATADDEAIKMPSAIQRENNKDDFPEMENPEEYALGKKIKDLSNVHCREQKKTARESREKNEQLRKGIVKQELDKGKKGEVLDETRRRQPPLSLPAASA